MTVAEVVALLQTLPQDAEFTVMNPWDQKDIWWPSGLDWWADFDGDTHWVSKETVTEEFIRFLYSPGQIWTNVIAYRAVNEDSPPIGCLSLEEALSLYRGWADQPVSE